MNAEQTKKDKIYAYSSFKQFCLPLLEFISAVAMACTTLYWDNSFV